MNYIKEKLKLVDLLVKPYDFKIKDCKQASTAAGGMITIIILAFAIYYFLSQLIQQQSTQFPLSISFDTSLTLNSSQIRMAIILDGNLNLQNNRQQKYNIGFSIRDVNISAFNVANQKQEQVTQILCDDTFLNVTSTQEQIICFDSNQLKILQPVTNSEQGQYVQIVIYSNIFNLNAKFVIVDTMINRMVSQNVTAQFIRIFPLQFYDNFLGNQVIEIAPVLIETQPSQLINIQQSGVNQVLYDGYKLQNQYNLYTPNQQKGHMITIQQSLDSLYLYGSNPSWDESILKSISQASGLTMFLISIFQLFYRIYNQHKMFEILMNSVFRFDVDEKHRQSQINIFRSQSNENNAEVLGTTGRDKTTNSKFKRQNQGESLKNLFDFNISYNFCNYLSYQIQRALNKLFRIQFKFLSKCFTTDQRTVAISQMAKQKIEQDLDLTNIVKKLYEIDCLKLLFFDDDQLILFNTFCQPVFQYDQILQQNNLLKQLQAQKTMQFNKNEDGNELKLAMQSKIPINQKLAKITRFFKAQFEATNPQELIDVFRKVKSGQNQNKEINQRLTQFTSYNETLYKLVSHQAQQLTIQVQQEESESSMLDSDHQVVEVKVAPSKQKITQQQPNSCEGDQSIKLE
ncbi:hypothetical protein pb186bvf_007005 [Paramecium bursaria]